MTAASPALRSAGSGVQQRLTEPGRSPCRWQRAAPPARPCSSPSPHGRANGRPTSPGPAERASARAGRQALAATPPAVRVGSPPPRFTAWEMSGWQSQRRHQRRRDQRRWRADPRPGRPSPPRRRTRRGPRRAPGPRDPAVVENSPIDERSRSLQRSDPGIVASTPTLSCGQARTQSRQNVQSMFPTLRGMYRSSSHPRCWALPRRQSCVTQRGADTRFLQPHLERRDQRAHEVELPDRADVLAEAGAAEQRVDRRRRRRSRRRRSTAVQSGLSHRANAS